MLTLKAGVAQLERKRSQNGLSSLCPGRKNLADRYLYMLHTAMRSLTENWSPVLKNRPLSPRLIISTPKDLR